MSSGGHHKSDQGSIGKIKLRKSYHIVRCLQISGSNTDATSPLVAARTRLHALHH
jgi:hypothetical protein